MGRGDACPNVAELSRLGWSTAAAGGDAINSVVLPPGKMLSFNLPATYLTPKGNYLRIMPDWLTSYPNGTNLYIGVRVAKFGDASLSAVYAGKLNIHEVNANLVSQTYRDFVCYLQYRAFLVVLTIMKALYSRAFTFAYDLGVGDAC